MKLRGTEKTLADGLAAFGATKNMTAMILTLLAEQEQLQMELINYMGGTPNGDSERIAGKGNRNGEVSSRREHR